MNAAPFRQPTHSQARLAFGAKRAAEQAWCCACMLQTLVLTTCLWRVSHGAQLELSSQLAWPALVHLASIPDLRAGANINRHPKETHLRADWIRTERLALREMP